MRLPSLILVMVALTACVPSTPPPPATAPNATAARAEVLQFLEVVETVEPVAEALCRAETPRQNCDFLIFVDRDPRSGVNAFQTVNRRGQPIIVFTVGLVDAAQNADELAFVLGHEAGHHIAQHLPQQQAQAAVGAEVFSGLARASGANAAEVGEAARLGSLVAARRFSQSAELEADALGAVIAFQAGYDPLAGAGFFNRLPDPNGAFLSTHPPNAARIDVVTRTVARLRGGGA